MILKTSQRLVQIEGVDAICEARIDFNGKGERLVALASSAANTNALVFRVKKRRHSEYPIQEDIFIGNLKSDIASKYMETLGKEGYLDISLLDYQKYEKCLHDYIFDNGVSKPYICHDTESQLHNSYRESFFIETPLLKLNVEDLIPLVEEEDESYLNMVGEKDEEGSDDSFLPDFHSSNV